MLLNHAINSPVNCIIIISLNVAPVVPEDSFDWAKYLIEGEDIDNGPYPDTPVSNS